MNTQWNAEVVTPVEEGAGTKVLDNQSNVQPTLEAGSNITIANGEISASGGGAEYTAGSGISIDENTISVDSDIRSGAAAGATAVQAADLATVATSGSYNDLSNKPEIPAAQVNSDWNAASGVSQILNKPTLATVATSGSYADLSNKPTIPTVDQVYDDTSANAQSGVAVASAISGKQDTISDLSTIRSGAEAGATAVQPSQLATVATTGSYTDLSNTPSIPAAQVNADWDAVDGVAQILNKPTIPTVAQSYNALSTDAMSGTAVAEAISGTGQVPSVTSTDNGKVLKATYAGGVGSFGWDAAPSGVPSTTSSDEGKVLGVTDNQGSLGWVAQTPAQVNSDWDAVSGAAQILNKPTLATVATSGSYDDLTNKPSIPAAQVNSDWDAVSGAAQILNKPTLATVATSGSYNDLSNKPSIPAAQIQSDWDQTDDTAADYIKNKPSIPAAQVNADWDAVSGVSQILNKPSLATVATSGSYADLSNKPTIPTVDQVYSASSANAQSGVAVASAVSGKQDTISDLETIRSGAALGATAVQPSALATVATSGSYNDLSNKPSIPAAQVNADWDAVSGISQILNKPSLATVATSGSYDDLTNKPTIPAAQVNSDWNAASGVSQILNKPSLATVATSGSYADLSNKPTIPTVDQSYSASSTNAQSGTAVAGALANIKQVPSSTSADEDKVLTVNSSGTPVWAAAQGGGGGSSYTFSAPLRESSGTVVLDVDTDELKVDVKTTALSALRSISAADSGYAWNLGTLTQDTSDTVYTFTFNDVPVPNGVATAVNAQGKHIYPLFVGETYGSWGNQWIVPTALTFNSSNNTVSGSFNVCFKSGEQDYPTHLDYDGALSWASVLVFAVASDVPASQVSSSSIYGSTTSGSTVSYSTGTERILMVKNPIPVVNLADNGKVLKATYSNGVGTFGWDTAPSDLPSVTGNAGKVLTVNSGATGTEWTNFTQIEVVASLPASPTSGVLYIVTGS